MDRTTGTEGGLLVVALHAIYYGGRWHGGFPGEETFYASHIQAAFQLLAQDRYEYLSLSGGRTHRAVDEQTGGLSEAEGARQYAIDQGLVSPDDHRIILETWARDSMENLYFSTLAFFSENAPVAIPRRRDFLGLKGAAIPPDRMWNAIGRKDLFSRSRRLSESDLPGTRVRCGSAAQRGISRSSMRPTRLQADRSSPERNCFCQKALAPHATYVQPRRGR